ncbi:hypothetical protein D6855_07785 [Butyrivibrio sp. CB08]|uniref:hypothetical protein n=1 Tax=Butyrivibrio sp. CB08 TaxID=2364879 RepID=UPI000EA97E47|nr:hypothetical protein [Butyrivibrio sp. CB08]RKM60598.1 hypothetical protein D6855_07785 [Butyrivibrio sp. CB08]
MSNKMLTKRLLAAGMSVAMSATLFATNSITIFAEEGEAPVEAIAAPADSSGEPAEFSFPEPVQSSDIVIEEKENCIVVTTTNTTEFYNSDMNSEIDGEQADYYLPVDAEDTAGQTLDYTDTYTQDLGVTEVSTVLKDSNGDFVTVPNEDGEEVMLKLDEDFDIDEVEPVLVVENNDGELEIVEDEENVFYGYFDADGNFVEDENGEAYFLTSSDNYELLGSAYTTIVDGEKVILDEEIYKALKGEDSIYSAEKQYDYTTSHYDHRQHKWVDETNAYSAEDLAEKRDVIEVDDERWNYTLARDDTRTYLYEPVEYFKAVVGSKIGNTTYARFYFVGNDGKTYYNEKAVNGRGLKKGDTISLDDRNKNDFVTWNSSTYATTETVYIRVFDKDGNLMFECDKTAYDNLKSENFVKVAGEKIAVEDKKGNTVLLDVDDYTETFRVDKTVNVTNVYYYTVQDKYEKDPMTVDIETEDKNYQLSVNFWENNRIGAQSVEVTDMHDGTFNVRVNFAYAAYRYDWYWNAYVPTTMEAFEDFTVAESEFGQDGTAKLQIKYTPSFDGVAKYYVREVLSATGLNDQRVTGDLVRISLAEVRDGDFAQFGDLVLFDEEMPTYVGGAETDYQPGWIWPIYPGFRYSVNLGEPETKTTNNDQPAPPSDNRSYPPRDPDADSPVISLLAAPAAGQVLGEQRPLAADGAAVLGASRARGTADETTAPIARVLVMAAVAATALFLTRKREENN